MGQTASFCLNENGYMGQREMRGMISLEATKWSSLYCIWEYTTIRINFSTSFVLISYVFVLFLKKYTKSDKFTQSY